MATSLVKISEDTFHRLPDYLQALRSLGPGPTPYVSAEQLAAHLRLDPARVHQDLTAAGAVGPAALRVADLIARLEALLGRTNTTDAFLVGAGRLGGALLGHEELERQGLKILAAFDADPRLVGRTIEGREVLAPDKLPELARRLGVHVGLLAVPAAAAQESADLLVQGGIRAIWNFAPAPLNVPEGVIVEPVRLAASLASLTGKLAAMLRPAMAAGGRA